MERAEFAYREMSIDDGDTETVRLVFSRESKGVRIDMYSMIMRSDARSIYHSLPLSELPLFFSCFLWIGTELYPDPYRMRSLDLVVDLSCMVEPLASRGESHMILVILLIESSKLDVPLDELS